MASRLFQRDTALEALESLRLMLPRCCTRVEPVGSVRRGKPVVKDLDLLVFLAADARGELVDHLARLGFEDLIHVRAVELRRVRFVHLATGVPVDLVMVHTLPEWWPALVALTGGPQTLAAFRAAERRTGWSLGEDGELVVRAAVKRPRFTSERGMFQAAGVTFSAPEDRP